MTASYDALVLGAGIVGAACALELASAGMRVAIVERDAIGSGATGAAMGHIVTMHDSEAQFALTSYSQSLWQALAAELPPSAEYRPTGTIWIAADAEEMNEVELKLAFYSKHNSTHGLAAERLDAQALAEAEPNLRGGLAGGALIPSDAVLDPLSAAGYLLEKAKRQSRPIDILLGNTVTQAGRRQIVFANGSTLQSPIIINATGAYAAALAPGIAIRKRKGHLILTDRYPDFARHQLVELGYSRSAHGVELDSVAFNVQPRGSGQILIGSSRQFDTADPAIDPHIITAIMARAAIYMPTIAGLSTVRAWTGFRAATPDKLPLIGPTADPSIYLATGHEGLGITTSLATARLLADHLLQRPLAIPIEPYLPERLQHKLRMNRHVKGEQRCNGTA